jgi:AcrR family transcriptional regulator
MKASPERESVMPRRTQEQRRTEAERRLVRAAAELVGEIGPTAVTLAKVGDRAGYSRGLATHYFGSRAALMTRLVGEVLEQFRSAMPTDAGSEPVVAQLQTFLRVYFEIVADLKPLNRALLVLWAHAASNPSDDIRPAIELADRNFRGAIAAPLRDAVANREIGADIDPETLATIIVGMLRGVSMQSLLDTDVDLAGAHREIERLLITRLQKGSSQ